MAIGRTSEKISRQRLGRFREEAALRTAFRTVGRQFNLPECWLWDADRVNDLQKGPPPGELLASRNRGLFLDELSKRFAETAAQLTKVAQAERRRSASRANGRKGGRPATGKAPKLSAPKAGSSANRAHDGEAVSPAAQDALVKLLGWLFDEPVIDPDAPVLAPANDSSIRLIGHLFDLPLSWPTAHFRFIKFNAHGKPIASDDWVNATRGIAQIFTAFARATGGLATAERQRLKRLIDARSGKPRKGTVEHARQMNAAEVATASGAYPAMAARMAAEFAAGEDGARDKRPRENEPRLAVKRIAAERLQQPRALTSLDITIGVLDADALVEFLRAKAPQKPK